jgi:mono/diheme cytochrome c family protein
MRIFTFATVVGALGLMIVPSLARATEGAVVYKTQCAKCHGEEGHGDTPIAKAMKVPALAGDAKVAALAPGDIAKAVKENKKHASFIAKVPDADLDAVATFVKGMAGKP